MDWLNLQEKFGSLKVIRRELLLTRRVVQNIFAWSETCFGVTIVSKATFGWWWMAWLLAEIQFWSEFGWSKPHFHDHLWPFIGGLLPRGQWAASAWQNVPQNDWGLRAADDSQWNLQFENGSYQVVVKHILALHPNWSEIVFRGMSVIAIWNHFNLHLHSVKTSGLFYHSNFTWNQF